MQKRALWWLVCFSLNIPAQYIYEANQDLFQLQKNANNFEGEFRRGTMVLPPLTPVDWP